MKLFKVIVFLTFLAPLMSLANLQESVVVTSYASFIKIETFDTLASQIMNNGSTSLNCSSGGFVGAGPDCSAVILDDGTFDSIYNWIGVAEDTAEGEGQVTTNGTETYVEFSENVSLIIDDFLSRNPGASEVLSCETYPSVSVVTCKLLIKN